MVSPSYRGFQIPAEEYIRELSTIPYLVSSVWRESSPHLLDCFPPFFAIRNIFSHIFGVSVLHICVTNLCRLQWPIPLVPLLSQLTMVPPAPEPLCNICNKPCNVQASAFLSNLRKYMYFLVVWEFEVPQLSKE